MEKRLVPNQEIKEGRNYGATETHNSHYTAEVDLIDIIKYYKILRSD